MYPRDTLHSPRVTSPFHPGPAAMLAAACDPGHAQPGNDVIQTWAAVHEALPQSGTADRDAVLCPLPAQVHRGGQFGLLDAQPEHEEEGGEVGGAGEGRGGPGGERHGCNIARKFI